MNCNEKYKIYEKEQMKTHEWYNTKKLTWDLGLKWYLVFSYTFDQNDWL